MRYLAVDLGLRRVGLAIGDERGMLASPYATRERKGNARDVETVLQTARGLGAVGIVVGLPINPNGEKSESENAARKFAALLAEKLREQNVSWPVELWNESFSTREAHERMKTLGISQKHGRDSGGSDSTDAIAASMILQNFLDHQYAELDELIGEDRVLDVVESEDAAS